MTIFEQTYEGSDQAGDGSLYSLRFDMNDLGITCEIIGSEVHFCLSEFQAGNLAAALLRDESFREMLDLANRLQRPLASVKTFVKEMSPGEMAIAFYGDGLNVVYTADGSDLQWAIVKCDPLHEGNMMEAFEILDTFPTQEDAKLALTAIRCDKGA